MKKDKFRAYCWKWLSNPGKGCLVISTINLEPSTTKAGVAEWLGEKRMNQLVKSGHGKIVRILISEMV